MSREFRIDFSGQAALIAFPHIPHPAMASPQSESHSPLAEIPQAPGAFEQFLDRNQKSIAALAVLVVLAAIAFVVMRGINESKETAAAHALFMADDAEALQKVADDHAGSRAAGSALLLLAERQWKDGEKDKSIETLRAFLADHPSHPALGTARASLGSKLMAQGSNDAAAEIFRTLAEDPAQSFIAPFASISLGDIAREGGDKSAAREYYSSAKAEEQTAGGFSQVATDRIAMLDADPPVAVDPPAPPAPQEPTAPTEPTPASANAAETGTALPAPVPAPAAEESR